MPVCKNCQESFNIYPEDKKFYQKIEISEPTFCLDCRQQRRLSWRNLVNLYLRKCDFTGKEVVSNYSPDKPHKIYDQSIWWSDKWEPRDYSQDFDFSRGFFEQFHELHLKVPRFNVYNNSGINSDYTHTSAHNKNCYLCFNIAYCEDCYYCTNYIVKSKDCLDCYNMRDSELLYQCYMIRECYDSKYLMHSRGCYDSAFLYDCHGCHDCFMCWNLRNAEYHIYNKKYSKEDYQKELEKIYPKTYEDWQKKQKEFLDKIKHQALHKYARIEKCNDCTGNQLENCQSVKNSYTAYDSIGCRYCYDFGELKDSYDSYEPLGGELQYDCHGCNYGVNMKFCSSCSDTSNCTYCDLCFNSKNLFGCISMNKHQEFCIFNKQYTEKEYNKLVPKIIDHMCKTGEWGNFFPMQDSPFTYNETVAQEFYPLTKEEIISKGLQWREEDEVAADPETSVCIGCKKNFKIVPQEKEMYDRMNLPEPKKCWKCRYHDRIRLRDPRQLWERKCGKCDKVVMSIYAPEKPEKVYCEECYQKEIY